MQQPDTRHDETDTADAPRFMHFALLPVLYFLAAKIGIAFTVMPEGIVTLWIPNSILLAALLRFHGRGYARFAILAVGAEIAADVPTFSLVEAALFGAVNVTEATIAYLLLRYWRFDPRFTELSDLPKFVLAGPMVAALASAIAGAFIYTHFRGVGTNFFSFLRIWWFGDGLGLAIFTPLLLSLGPYAVHVGRTTNTALRVTDGAVVLLALLTLGFFIGARHGVLEGIYVGRVLLLPFVIYVAVRTRLRWTALTIATIALLDIVMTARGYYPRGTLNAHDAVIASQEFIFITSLIGLGLVALLSQLRTGQDELKQANLRLEKLNLELESRVAERTTELRVLAGQLEHQAMTDPLTGLPNRRALFDAMKREIRRERRAQQPLAVIILDIDHFKAINDRYGHHVGDVVLRQTIDVMAPIMRASDTLARYGGEEFVLIAPQTDPPDALELAERMRRALDAADFVIDGNSIHVTASFGVGSLDESDEEPHDLLQRADDALYEAKKSGRNRVVAV